MGKELKLRCGGFFVSRKRSLGGVFDELLPVVALVLVILFTVILWYKK